jgi:hypothetical protein
MAGPVVPRDILIHIVICIKAYARITDDQKINGRDPQLLKDECNGLLCMGAAPGLLCRTTREAQRGELVCWMGYRGRLRLLLSKSSIWGAWVRLVLVNGGREQTLAPRGSLRVESL